MIEKSDSIRLGKKEPWFSFESNNCGISFRLKEAPQSYQLLKALVALGRQRVTEQRFVDVFWPDEESDKAHNAFSTI